MASPKAFLQPPDVLVLGRCVGQVSETRIKPSSARAELVVGQAVVFAQSDRVVEKSLELLRERRPRLCPLELGVIRRIRRAFGRVAFSRQSIIRAVPGRNSFCVDTPLTPV